ncbi:hypothetical protein [Rhodococcus wratislaviensis]|uniref:hypothetical protein n=1 Tax=Rhodococcus wratislaviensis TaxID=44752 RepID=UPI0021006249|nr:hypothetical protein [Rhodococcus wratislaviensis]
MRELNFNGRASTTSLARSAGISEATARRVHALLAEGVIRLRAMLGLHAEAAV